jgi:hypothetical protein
MTSKISVHVMAAGREYLAGRIKAAGKLSPADITNLARQFLAAGFSPDVAFRDAQKLLSLQFGLEGMQTDAALKIGVVRGPKPPPSTTSRDNVHPIPKPNGAGRTAPSAPKLVHKANVEIDPDAPPVRAPAIQRHLDTWMHAMRLAPDDARRLQAITTTSKLLAPFGDAAIEPRDYMTSVAYDMYNLDADAVQAAFADRTRPMPKGSANNPDGWPDLGKRGRPSATCANARHAIEKLGLDCKYDLFHDRKLVSGHEIEQWAGEFSDHASQMLRVLIKERFGFDPGKDNVNDAAIQLCLQHQFDPVCDYLNGLVWDEKPRLDTWMTTYLGADNTKLNRTIGRLALVAAVRRARQPGCKFDQIIVLEGPEGTGKSTAIKCLASKENFSDQTIIGLDDRQQQEAVRGVWLFEIADLAGMSKADVDRTKAFASRQSDRARPAYGRHRVELLRRCVFFGSTNNDTYLKSQTGNRRTWPVKTGKIDLGALRQDRDQLWAEAAQVEATSVSLTLPEALWPMAAIEQDKRRDHDPWDDLLADVKGTISEGEERISVKDLFAIHLNLPTDRRSDTAYKRLVYSMARLGWERPEYPIRIGTTKVRGFRRQDAGPAAKTEPFE